MPRGGKREGAGRPPVPTGQEKMTNYTIRTYKHERPLVRQYLKQLRHEKRGKKMKLIRRTGKECDMPTVNQVEFCPHCGKMICHEIIRLMFPCEYCHNCGGKVEY